MPGIRFPSGDFVTITLAYFEQCIYRSLSGLFPLNSVSNFNSLKRFRVEEDNVYILEIMGFFFVFFRFALNDGCICRTRWSKLHIKAGHEN